MVFLLAGDMSLGPSAASLVAGTCSPLNVFQVLESIGRSSAPGFTLYSSYSRGVHLKPWNTNHLYTITHLYSNVFFRIIIIISHRSQHWAAHFWRRPGFPSGRAWLWVQVWACVAAWVGTGVGAVPQQFPEASEDNHFIFRSDGTYSFSYDTGELL